MLRLFKKQCILKKVINFSKVANLNKTIKNHFIEERDRVSFSFKIPRDALTADKSKVIYAKKRLTQLCIPRRKKTKKLTDKKAILN